MGTSDVVLCHPVRTAIGAYNGTLKGVPATELGTAAVRETLARSGLDPERIGGVVMGNVVQAGNRMNPARQAAAEPRQSWTGQRRLGQAGMLPQRHGGGS